MAKCNINRKLFLLIIIILGMSGCSLINPVKKLAIDNVPKNEKTVEVVASVDGVSQTDSEISKNRGHFQSDSKQKVIDGFAHRAGNNYYHSVFHLKDPKENINVNIDIGKGDKLHFVYYIKMFFIFVFAIFLLMVLYVFLIKILKWRRKDAQKNV